MSDKNKPDITIEGPGSVSVSSADVLAADAAQAQIEALEDLVASLKLAKERQKPREKFTLPQLQELVASLTEILKEYERLSNKEDWFSVDYIDGVFRARGADGTEWTSVEGNVWSATGRDGILMTSRRPEWS